MTSVKNRFRAAVLGLIAAQRADALKLNTFQNQQHGNDGHDSDTHTEYAVVEESDGIFPTISSTSLAADEAGEPILEDVDMDPFSALMGRMALNEHFTAKGGENSDTNTRWGKVRAFVRNTKEDEGKVGTISDHISTSTFNTPNTIPYSPPKNVEDADADAMEIVGQLGDRLSGVSLSVAQDSPRSLSPTQSVSRSPSRGAFDNIRLRGSGSGENMVKLDRQDSDNIGFRGFLNKNVQEVEHFGGYSSYVPAAERSAARLFEQKHGGCSDDVARSRSVSSSTDINAVKRDREGVEQGLDMSKENPTVLIKKQKTFLKP